MTEATRAYRDPSTEVTSHPRRSNARLACSWGADLSGFVKRVGEGLWRALPLSPQAQRAAPLAPHGASTMTKDAMQPTSSLLHGDNDVDGRDEPATTRRVRRSLRYQLHEALHVLSASKIARCEIGSAFTSTPSGASASFTALATAAGAPR